MRPIALASTVLGLSLLIPITSAAPAGAAPEAKDWRATACVEEPGLDVTVSGAHTVVNRQVTPVAEARGMTLIVDRLDFSGKTCELFYVRGAIPAGAAVSLGANSLCTYSRFVLNGVDKGEGASCTSFAGPTRLYPSNFYADVPNNVLVAAVVTYRPHESGVMPSEPGMPPELMNAPYSATYVRSEWYATLMGKTLVPKPFDRSAATDRTARTVSARTIAQAGTVYAARVAKIQSSGMPASWKKDELATTSETRATTVGLARRTLRLALRGVRLTNKRFNWTYSGTLLP